MEAGNCGLIGRGSRPSTREAISPVGTERRHASRWNRGMDDAEDDAEKALDVMPANAGIHAALGSREEEDGFPLARD
jgi:hypothetical protein